MMINKQLADKQCIRQKVTKVSRKQATQVHVMFWKMQGGETLSYNQAHGKFNSDGAQIQKSKSQDVCQLTGIARTQEHTSKAEELFPHHHYQISFSQLMLSSLDAKCGSATRVAFLLVRELSRPILVGFLKLLVHCRSGYNAPYHLSLPGDIFF